MQSIPVTFYERVLLWNLTGNHQVQSLRDASVYLRLIEKLRPSDEEMREAQFVQEGQGFRWSVPERGYGDRTVELEDTEAAALRTAIEGAQNIRVNDAAWMQRIADQCGVKAMQEA
jgi:hypothetical protein